MLNTVIPYRCILAAVFLADISISIYYRRKAKKGGNNIFRKEEGVLLIFARLAVAGPLYGSLIAYMINPGWMLWSVVNGPEWTRIMGMILLFITVPLTYQVMKTIGSNISETVLIKENHKLITTGVYHWVRHPLYSDGLMLFGGAVLVSGNWFMGLFLAISIIALNAYVIPKEEKHLIKKFGEEYLNYMQRTGKLIPKLFYPDK